MRRQNKGSRTGTLGSPSLIGGSAARAALGPPTFFGGSAVRSAVGLATALALVAVSGCATGSHAAPGDDQALAEDSTEEERRAVLDGYGEWVSSTRYGVVWRPVGVAGGWRPYTLGRWAYRPVGWTWVSDYPWGWVAFHYGRWVYDDLYGWVWIPGDVWGPAWVAWTYSDTYIGWAPLPPGVGVGWVGSVPYRWWCFAPRRSFARRRFRPRIAPVDRNRGLWNASSASKRRRPVGRGQSVAAPHRRSPRVNPGSAGPSGTTSSTRRVAPATIPGRIQSGNLAPKSVKKSSSGRVFKPWTAPRRAPRNIQSTGKSAPKRLNRRK